MPPASPLTPADGAAAIRDAVTALSRRSAIDLGDLVAAASPARSASLAEKLERIGAMPAAVHRQAIAAAFDDGDLVTLDSWIRLADSATLHDDAREADARRGIAERLRAVRQLVAPGDAHLSVDPRDA